MSSITPEQIIAGMRDPRFVWTTSTITYSIPKIGSVWSTSGAEASAPGYAVFSVSQAASFRQYMVYIGGLIATPIVETDDLTTTGQIRVAFTDMPTGVGAYAGLPGTSAEAGDIWLGQGMRDFENGIGNDIGGDRPRVAILHEIGHALGLMHPHDLGVIPTEWDNAGNTVMSYTPYPNFTQFTLETVDGVVRIKTNVVQTNGYMVYDMLVLQALYGVNTSTRTGDDRYTFDGDKAVITTIYDAGGNDTIDLAGHRRASIIDLTPGGYSSIDIQTAAEQIAYWRAAFPSANVDVAFFVNSIAAHGQLYTGQNNLGIAYGVTIENVIAGDGDDVILGNAANNMITGSGGSDVIDGGAGTDIARYANSAASFRVTVDDSGWKVSDLRAGHTADVDTLRNIELVAFQDKTLTLGTHALSLAVANVMRAQPGEASAQAVIVDLYPKISGGQMDAAGLGAALAKAAIATTSVATLSYQFFTGKMPGQAGLDYLVAASGPNANNLNSAYYQSFNLENRYINFAVNLGKFGEGAAKFSADYGALNLFEATRKAYATIFGAAPADEKVHAMIDTRGDYFEVYGRDGPNGVGTKAAMVGWLLAEAAKADIGMFAKVNDAFFTDLADGATYGVDLVGVYGRAEYNYPA